MSSNCGLFVAWALSLELTMCFTVMSPLVPTNMDLFPGEFLVSSVQLLFFVPVQQCSSQNCCVKAKKCPADLLSKWNFYTICHNSPLDSHMLLDLYYDFLFWVITTTTNNTGGWKRKRRKTEKLGTEVTEGEGEKKHRICFNTCWKKTDKPEKPQQQPTHA